MSQLIRATSLGKAGEIEMSQVGERQRQRVAVCGSRCEECTEYRAVHCPGCGHESALARQATCAVFHCCVAERELDDCSQCLDFPCQLFWGHASPMEVVRRYRALVGRR